MIDAKNGELQWGAYARDGRALEHYFRSERYYAAFPPGAFVVDVGCGTGENLQDLLDRGCRGIGTETSEWCLARARERGRDVVSAPVERMPLRDASVDGIIFRGVLPFADEDRAYAELARVLRPGGRVEAEYLGIGFAVRELLLAPKLRSRYYGTRALANSLLMLMFGRKLPGKYGDVTFVTRGRLARHYARHGFRLVLDTPAPRFLGLPVFIYHAIERAGP